MKQFKYEVTCTYLDKNITFKIDSPVELYGNEFTWLIKDFTKIENQSFNIGTEVKSFNQLSGYFNKSMENAKTSVKNDKLGILNKNPTKLKIMISDIKEGLDCDVWVDTIREVEVNNIEDNK